MKNRRQNIATIIRFVTVLAFLCLTLSGVLYSRFVNTTFGSGNIPEASSTPRPKTKASPKAVPTPQASKYSKFKHNTHLDLKLACDSCHKVPTSNWDKVRSKETAFPDVTDYPKHESCVGCHRQQFFSGKPPAICSNCHTNPSPNDSSRHPFPNPRELFDVSPKGKKAASDFGVAFPHDKHIDIVSRNENPFEVNRSGIQYVKASARRAEESCAVCHQTYMPQGKSKEEFFTPPPKDLGEGFWLKKGTFKTAPIGHTTCFTCHNADMGLTPAPTDCGTCHKLSEKLLPGDFDEKLAETMGITDKIMLSEWRRRDSSGKFRHEWDSHVDLSCSTCHTVGSIITTEAKTKKVPVFSCNNCHITATLDDGGILNTEIDSRKKDPKFDCVKCHITFGKLPIPESHIKAVADSAKGE